MVGVIADPDLDGAGLHQIVRGGFLNVHTDFQSHVVNSDWSRQINLLICRLTAASHTLARVWPEMFAYQNILEAEITTLDDEATPNRNIQ